MDVNYNEMLRHDFNKGEICFICDRDSVQEVAEAMKSRSISVGSSAYGREFVVGHQYHRRYIDGRMVGWTDVRNACVLRWKSVPSMIHTLTHGDRDDFMDELVRGDSCINMYNIHGDSRDEIFHVIGFLCTELNKAGIVPAPEYGFGRPSLEISARLLNKIAFGNEPDSIVYVKKSAIRPSLKHGPQLEVMTGNHGGRVVYPVNYIRELLRYGNRAAISVSEEDFDNVF